MGEDDGSEWPQAGREVGTQRGAENCGSGLRKKAATPTARKRRRKEGEAGVTRAEKQPQVESEGRTRALKCVVWFGETRTMISRKKKGQTKKQVQAENKDCGEILLQVEESAKTETTDLYRVVGGCRREEHERVRGEDRRDIGGWGGVVRSNLRVAGLRRKVEEVNF